MNNLIEEYYEYMFEFSYKLNKIEKCFADEHGFRITYKDNKRIALVKKNIFLEFYQDSDTDKYVFDVYISEDNKRYFTNSFDKIDQKIKEIEKLIKNNLKGA